MKSRLRVLTYHRVAEVDDGSGHNPALVSATPREFVRQMEHLSGRYRVVGLEEVLEAQRGGRPLPGKAVLVTFDDAYSDFRDTVWPVLRSLGLPATLFVPTGYPGSPGRVYWWDRLYDAVMRTRVPCVSLDGLGSLRLDTPEARRGAARRLQGFLKEIPHAEAMELVDRVCGELGVEGPEVPALLCWDSLRALERDGVALASHTRNHPVLTGLEPEEIRREVQESMADLRRELGKTLPVLCYPTGAHDDVVVEVLAEEGVELAFTCMEGQNVLPSRHPLRLRRTNITRRSSLPVFQLRLRRLASYLDMVRRRRRVGTYPPRDRRPGRSVARRPAVAYVMSRFPKLSETFVLNEIATLDALGVPVEVYPLLRERQEVRHPEADIWVERAHFQPFVSLPILGAQLHFLRRDPGKYVRVWLEVLGKTWGSTNFFIGALGILPKAVRFARDMEERGVTHVHAHFATHPTVAALVVNRLTGIPFSFTAHGSDLHVDRRMLDAKVETATFAVTVSRFNREVMVEACGEHVRDKIHVVHCGVDTDFFAPRRRRRGDGTFRFACVASFEEVKGHRFLLEACGLLRDRGIDFRCHLVGDGPLRREVEDRIERLGLQERVRVHGPRPRGEVARLLSGMDAAVLASHPTRLGKREGIPVALMEAMAAGLPVVATRISGVPELVEAGVTGFLVPSGDPASLAEGLERLGADPELRERMGRAGRERVRRSFDQRSNALRLVELFGESLPVPLRERRLDLAAGGAGVAG